MAIKKTIWNTGKYIPIAPGCCDELVLCIDPNCKYITANSSGIIYATVQNKGRFIGDARSPQFDKHRCNDLYQYELAYDDTQMAINKVTGLPYELKCACIIEAFPYVCIYNYLSTLGDWVVDRNNVTVVDNEETDTFTVTIPIIDRINGTSIGSFSLDLSSLFDNTWGTLSVYDTPTGGYTFTDGGGNVQEIQILSQDANNNATVGTDNGIFVGTDDLSTFDTPTGGYTHTALDGTPQEIQIISQDANNNASAGTDNGIFVGTDDLSTFDTPTGGYTHTALDGTSQEIQIISQDVGNVLSVGSDNGVYFSSGAAPTFTDSMTSYDNPAGGYTHTAVNGASQVIQILSQDVGNIITAGSDDGNYLDCDTINACVDPAPLLSTDSCQGLEIGTDSKIYIAEPTSLQKGSSSSGTPGTDISSVGTYTLDTILLELPSISACRDVSVMMVSTGDIELNLPAGIVVDIFMQEQIDGVGLYTDVARRTIGPFSIDMPVIPFALMPTKIFDLGAGVSQDIRRTISVQTTTGAVGASVLAYSVDMRAHLVTK